MDTTIRSASGGPASHIDPGPSFLAPPSEDHLDYRPDIDGLRAIAVLAVVAFHAFPERLPGGFVGVDIFFVISGYLISGIILRAQQKEHFSLLGFYARRVRRIFPALLAMLVLVWILGRLMLLADEFPQLGKHVLAGSGFAMNLVLYADTQPYFGSINSPLIHLWSLGVEEQFYLVWPLFLMMIWRLPRLRGWLIAGAIVISFAMNLHSVAIAPLGAFYSPINRLWELALGGLLVYASPDTTWGSTSESHASAWAGLSAVFGLSIIAASLILLGPHMVFPGWFALAPCMGAALLIWAGPHAWVNRVLLSHPTMVFFGLISYPLYLLHWPLLSFAHTADWRGYTPLIKIVVIVVSIALSYALYRYIETPIRHARPMKFAPGLCAAMAVSAIVGYLTFTRALPARTAPPEVQPFLEAALEPFPYPEQEGLIRYGTGSKRTLFIGDSTIAQYHWRIEKLLSEDAHSSRSVEFVWRAGCASEPSLSLVDPAACKEMMAQGLARAQAPEVDTIVVGFCWYAYFMADFASDRVGAAAPLLPGTEEAIIALERTLGGFTKAGKRVYLVLQSPIDPGYPPRKMIRRSLSPPGFLLDVRPPQRAVIERTYAPFVHLLEAAAKRVGAITIDPMQSLCDTSVCRSVTGDGKPVFRDPFHLRSSYIRNHVHYLDATVLSTLGTTSANSE
jgi:peptidoglycan/LPS O-acetylase OafA/YrhL